MPKYTEIHGETLRDVSVNSDGISFQEHDLNREVVKSGCIACLKSLFLDIFMPRGFPHSVSEDYVSYQVWDTIQAFASSMNHALSTEAILRGAGIGNEAATAIAATVAWLLKDGLGMISRIVFAWLTSPYFDAHCKQWRLLADILNDITFCMDLVVPNFPRFFVFVLCLSSLLRSVVGVAGTSTRTAVTSHQAISDNLGDVAAKDVSQETVVNICALACSLLLLHFVSGSVVVWPLFIVFTSVHLYANYRAIKSLQFRTLNHSLLEILIRKYVKTGSIDDVRSVNDQESVFSLRVSSSRYYGCSLIKTLSSANELKFVSSKFIASCNLKLNSGCVSMARFSNTKDQLRAAACLELMLHLRIVPSLSQLDEFTEGLKKVGWSIDKHRLVFDRWIYMEK
ncbi:unnamed protein product [Thelazia callipaeda]|uniref:RUS1 family protein C16orf58 homolog n=1 Tax=Thelazia callipaeda TaxID=103827 RepID=A0A0N5DAB7_THECL|nr:unnamed protein product [Thelazia callipaeda]